MYEYKQSQYLLRRAIGLLGLALPVLLWSNHPELLASMSHYYYASACIFFVSILFTFGLILITYKGYPRKEGERFSDDLVTNLAGTFILVAVLVPSKSDGSLGHLFFTDSSYLFGYKENDIKNTIHLASAGLFLILSGFMSVFKFTLNNEASASRNMFFKICGYIIWGCVAAIILIFVLESILNVDFNTILPGYVFWIEWIAVYAFAIAWLVKGRIDNGIKKILRF